MAPRTLDIVVVADLDRQSKQTNASLIEFVSFLQHGTLTVSRDAYAVVWGAKQRVATTISDGERGFELSELAWFQGKLLTFDDRTGTVFELKGFADRREHAPLQAEPLHVVTEGDGEAEKGQKHEWATVKDGELYMGSNGLALADTSGSVKRANEWVAVLDEANTMRRANWANQYARVREALGISETGYVTHEAVEWSSIHSKWFLLPRRVSREAFDDEQDACRGANKLVIASEDFQRVQVVDIRAKSAPERGFSSFKFVPNTNDSVIVAIKSVEVGDTQDAFLTVFDIQGNVLLEDSPLPGGYKFEGVAFVQDWANLNVEEPPVVAGCCVPLWS